MVDRRLGAVKTRYFSFLFFCVVAQVLLKGGKSGSFAPPLTLPIREAGGYPEGMRCKVLLALRAARKSQP